MSQMTKQTDTSIVRPDNDKAKRIVGVIFGFIEVVLGLRFIFLLLGANPNNGFIKALRFSTQFVVGIFEGIFAKVSLNESGNAVFEPATLIAMVLVALIAWGVMKLMTSYNSNRVERTEYVSTAIPVTPKNPDLEQKDRL